MGKGQWLRAGSTDLDSQGVNPIVYPSYDCYGLFTKGNACIWGIGGGSAGTESQWPNPVSVLDPNTIMLFFV